MIIINENSNKKLYKYEVIIEQLFPEKKVTRFQNDRKNK
jgi:hypothetical protein